MDYCIVIPAPAASQWGHRLLDSELTTVPRVIGGFVTSYTAQKYARENLGVSSLYAIVPMEPVHV